MKKIDQFVKDLAKSFSTGGGLVISLKLDNQSSTDKLFWLKQDDRDMLSMTNENIREITKSFAKAYVKSDKHVSSPQSALTDSWVIAGKTAKSIILKRFGTGNKDIPMKQLTKEYIKKKGNSKIGYDTGALYRDIRKSNVVVKYRGK